MVPSSPMDRSRHFYREIFGVFTGGTWPPKTLNQNGQAPYSRWSASRPSLAAQGFFLQKKNVGWRTYSSRKLRCSPQKFWWLVGKMYFLLQIVPVTRGHETFVSFPGCIFCWWRKNRTLNWQAFFCPWWKMGAHLSGKLNLASLNAGDYSIAAMLVYQEFKQIMIQISSFPKTHTSM